MLFRTNGKISNTREINIKKKSGRQKKQRKTKSPWEKDCRTGWGQVFGEYIEWQKIERCMYSCSNLVATSGDGLAKMKN